MSTVTVRMKVKPEAHDMFLRILEEVTAAVKENEPSQDSKKARSKVGLKTIQ